MLTPRDRMALVFQTFFSEDKDPAYDIHWFEENCNRVRRSIKWMA